ncbi:MAG TPA: YggT family protein [Halanaerobiales bacterium]|nr:YggT family protein [Halanaerobiales bacterium]
MYMLANTIGVLFNILDWLIIGRVIISWVQPNPSNQMLRQLIKFTYQVTEPILAPIRRILPTSNIGIDFSPIVAIFALSIIRSFLIRIIV